jgi:hypothetical protein
MFHLAGITVMQLILIQVGIIFQLIAIGTYLYEAGSRRHLTRHLDALERAEREELQSKFMEQAKSHREQRVRGEGFDEPRENDIKARGLTRTAKVQFRQTFNFHRHGT